MNSPRVLIIVPCYNEQEMVEALLKEIKDQALNIDTIVIDDGSKDETYQVANKLSPTIRLIKNLGIGGAVQTGIQYARDKGYEFCVQIDGDGQHPPEEINKLLQAYHETPRSILIGSRYLKGGTFQSTWARRFGGHTIAFALNFLFGRHTVTDPTSGMRLMDRKAIEFFAKHYPHDFPEPISLAWALKEGLMVGEVAVQMRSRQHGDSSIAGMKPIFYMIRVLGYILIARFSRVTP